MHVDERRANVFLTACVLLPTAFAAGPLAAQTAGWFASSTVAVESSVPSAPVPSRAPMFGRSNAITILLAEPNQRLDPTGLAVLGGGWELGHRWVPMNRLNESILPGEPIEVSSGPAYTTTGSGNSEIVAPGEPGVWQLESGSGTRLTVVTRTPASRARGGWLNGYHIGTYPTAGSNRDDAYAPPEYFIEVTPETQHLPVSRHLRLGQFLTKDQFDVWPKYVALDLRLIDKLELVIQELRAMGVRADRIHVMSGFRTPQYNGPGGDGRAALSRHMWGDAADVWIDNDENGFMDDLNGDGLVDLWDAVVMMRAVERVEQKYPELVGGAGLYPETSTHGPYIHIDARGYRARW